MDRDDAMDQYPYEEQRQKFVTLANSGRFTVTELCLDFGISRKCGHKWLVRHAEGGAAALADGSRAPHSVPLRTSEAIERIVVGERRLHPTWGLKKIRATLERKHSLEAPPAISRLGEILKRHGMIEARRRRPGAFKVKRGGGGSLPRRCVPTMYGPPTSKAASTPWIVSAATAQITGTGQPQ